MTWLGSRTHAEWLTAETDALLAFARSSRVPNGFGYLDADGAVDPGQPAELWVTARMTHSFALGTMLGRPGYGPLADHGVAALRGAFADGEHGGWFSAVALEGDGVPDDTKAAYAHGFVILAGASAAAAGRPGGRALLDEALAVSERFFWRDDEGMAVESWDRAFGVCEDYRGVNANMHTVEAYLAAADVTGDDVWLDRAVRITRRVLDDFARANDWRIPEHFSADWEPLLDYNRDEPAHPFRPYGATVGHSLEWARLVLHAREALRRRGLDAETWMLEAARELFDRAVADGWAVDGADGFVYTVDFAGEPVVRERMHWVVCEGIGAAAALEAVTGEVRYEERYRQWWDYAAEHLIEAPGRWRHELSAENGPSAGTWSGKPDIYHALQATLIPRLPLAPALAPAVAAGLVDNRHPMP
ncbi:AGE family epimerase/isomerase [Georgenia faecalis]|uniref:AGE family epimerase/isomerase n=1 Tax=Georgenia faecalis TaxID=2483799 RepID=A0ABV9D4X0_9MICO|nr:AGE family epimerase/isomerase [Georgenia faecalis]